MTAITQTQSTSKAARWIGRTLSGFAVAFLLWDGTIKLLELTPVLESFTRLGYPVDVSIGVGILELVCVAAYVIPRTSILGAVLLTGFLGGAISTHLRVEDPFLTHTFFPIYVATLVWGGLVLRNSALRAITRQLFGAPVGAR
jgi:uncharacterized membrane protein YphA (DoxX/SURF4 family)